MGRPVSLCHHHATGRCLCTSLRSSGRVVQGIRYSGGTPAGMLLARPQYLFKQVSPHCFEESQRAVIQLALTTFSEMIKKLNKLVTAVQTLAHCEACSIGNLLYTDVSELEYEHIYTCGVLHHHRLIPECLSEA